MKRRRPVDVRADVVVVGGGLTGCLVALELARAGRRTVVLEAAQVGEGPGLGHLPSGPPLSYVEAVARWGRAGARELWERQRESQAAMRDLLAELGEDCGHRAEGGFTLAEDRGRGTLLAESEDLLREDGFAGEFLDGYMLEARFAVHGFAAGYWAAEEAELDAGRLAAAAARAAREAGADLRERCPVRRLELSGEGVVALSTAGTVRAPVGVVAATAAAPALVPFFRGRVEAAACRGLALEARPSGSLPSPVRLRGGRAGWTTTGGTLEVQAFSGADEPRRIAEAHLAIPSRALDPARSWSRRGGLSCDGLPWVGPLPGLPLVAALAGGLALAYTPLVSRWAAAAALTGRDPAPAPLRAARAAPAV